MGEDAASLVQRLQEAIVAPDLLALFRTLHQLDATFDCQAEHDEETVLSSFVKLTQWNAAHKDALEALLARGFDPTYATSQFFTPSEELDGVPTELHELLSRTPDGFRPNDKVQRWLATPLDRLDEAFGLAPPDPPSSGPEEGEVPMDEEPSKPIPDASSASPATTTAENAAASKAPFSEMTNQAALSPASSSRPTFVPYCGMLPPPRWNAECDRLKMHPIACAGLFVMGSCHRYKCQFAHGPLPWGFEHENLLPGSARQPKPSHSALLESQKEERSYKPFSGKCPPMGWIEAWTKCDAPGLVPCAHFHLLGRCSKSVRCDYSHAPLPRCFHHVNIPPWAKREEEKDEFSHRYRSPSVHSDLIDDRPYEPYTASALPPPGWKEAWAATGSYGSVPCAHWFILNRYNYKNGAQQCPHSHSPLPRSFYHVNLPPDAPRDHDIGHIALRRGRSRSPVRRDERDIKREPSPARRLRSKSRSRERPPRRASSPDAVRHAIDRRRRARSRSWEASGYRPLSRRSKSPPSAHRPGEGAGLERRRSASPRRRIVDEVQSDDIGDLESTGIRRSDMIRLNGPEILQVPITGTQHGSTYKTHYCVHRERGCSVKAGCHNAHTERELEYYRQMKWKKTTSTGQTVSLSAKVHVQPSKLAVAEQPIAFKPDLSSLNAYDLSDQQKELVRQAICEPDASTALSLPIVLSSKRTRSTEALAALSDKATAFTDDADQEERYRSYLRFCAGHSGSYPQSVLAKIAAYNEQIKRWSAQVVNTSTAGSTK